MRLIDADTLHLVCRVYDSEAKRIIWELNHAPTVDAIPIDWILNHDQMPEEGKGHDAIMDMVNSWREENGKQK